MCLCWQQSCYNFAIMEPRAPKSAAVPPRAQGPGRPRIHSEAWAKVSVVLFERQVQHLDRLAEKARRRGHKSINRACIIRGLIDGMLLSGIDLSKHSSEARVREDVARRLRKSSRLL
jgi:RIO-like serine/threonine protein kinase